MPRQSRKFFSTPSASMTYYIVQKRCSLNPNSNYSDVITTKDPEQAQFWLQKEAAKFPGVDLRIVVEKILVNPTLLSRRIYKYKPGGKNLSLFKNL